MSAVEILRIVPLFSELKDPVLENIAKLCQQKVYQKDQVILMEEDTGDSFFIIESGSVKVTRLSEDGREVILSFLYEGDFFGELSILDGEKRSANVIALEKTLVYMIDRSDFLDLLERNPLISIALLKELANRLRRSDQHIEALSLSDAEGKIALVILRIAEEYGIHHRGCVTVNNLPLQQDIANMAGTTRETVSRMLKNLEKKHWIEREGHKLTINEYEKFKDSYLTKG
ncbi:MAG: Crp/Fnr family transcriptional regulator [Candidatus Marinimicrobia bacterium CG1_02_48_14]|nr:MAG: Crp/Fnr family transcriptional regulator [Candidatus Marinimicrobia bacterium CG1_02_48_14]